MTRTADGVEKAYLLTLGNRAQIEEDSPVLNAGHHWRIASSQSASPHAF